MKIYAAIVTILFILFAGLFLTGVNLGNLIYPPSKIADISDANGSQKAYKLLYSKDGDLTLLSDSNPYTPVTYRDYYGSTKVKNFVWKAERELEIEMEDGPIITFHVPKVFIKFDH